MRVDVNAFLGEYPYRRVPGGEPDALLRAMDRAAIHQAWVSHLPALFWRDPTAGNPALFSAADAASRLRPVPAVHPGLPGWEHVLGDAAARGVPAVRCDPVFYGLDPVGDEMRALAAACGEAGLSLMLAVRLEDLRQRHPTDGAAELEPWMVRRLIRSDARVRLIVTHAGREFIEQVHFGSTPAEAGRILWDICWIWGPPEDHLALLLRTVGSDRFAFGTGMPLRLPEASVAKLDLLSLPSAERARLEEGNASGFGHRSKSG